MKRRCFLLSSLAALVTPAVAKAHDLDSWSRTPGQVPVHPASFDGIVQPDSGGIVTPSKSSTVVAKTLDWAQMCIRRGAHWTINGVAAWLASVGLVKNHLVQVHGHNYAELSGHSKEQLLNLHDAHHEGRSYMHYQFPPTPPNGMNRMPQAIMDTLHQSNCPGGVCPAPRRGIFGFFRRG